MPITLSAGPACYKSTSPAASGIHFGQQAYTLPANAQDMLHFGRHAEPKRSMRKGPLMLLLMALGLGGCATTNQNSLKQPAPNLNTSTPRHMHVLGYNLNSRQIKGCVDGANARDWKLGLADLSQLKYVCTPTKGRPDQFDRAIYNNNKLIDAKSAIPTKP